MCESRHSFGQTWASKICFFEYSERLLEILFLQFAQEDSFLLKASLKNPKVMTAFMHGFIQLWEQNNTSKPRTEDREVIEKKLDAEAVT